MKNTMYIRDLALFLLLMALPVSALAQSNTYIVMSSSDSAIEESVDLKDLRDIFLGHRILWRNGDRIFAAHIKKQSSEMVEFLNDVIGMTPRKFNRYWRRRLFSGKGHPPIELDSDKKAIDYVYKTEGAIAVVSKLPTKKYKGLHFFEPVKSEARLHLIED